MKICQTLWTCHNDLLSDSFGWLSAQHHLIAWTYSCLKLKELYPDIEFYTDSHGAKILIDTLKLPYSKYHIDYNDLRYNPSLWALPKILTYGKQQAPFIHVDGDVFVFEKFSNELNNARLIAQNPEISTEYYQKSFEPILKRITYTPNLFKENLLAKSPKAYNAGILGGCDTELIQAYTSEAVNFVEQNYTVHSNGNFNIVFEQLLFHSMAQANNAEVKCYYSQTLNDNGYSADQFGDFLSISKLKYLHLIGGLKRDKFVCDQLTKRLYYEYPEYFIRIATLFKTSHQNANFFLKDADSGDKNNSATKAFKYEKTRELINRMFPENNLKSNKDIFSFVKTKNNTILNKVCKYEKELHSYLKKFKSIDKQEVLNIESKTVESSRFFANSEDEMNSYTLYLNPFIEIIETPINVLHFDPYQYLSREEEDSEITVACIPQSFFEGYKEVELNQICINIVSTIYENGGIVDFQQLKQKVLASFDRTDNDEQAIESLFMARLKYLVGNNLIYMD
jgi:hypothetical protein